MLLKKISPPLSFLHLLRRRPLSSTTSTPTSILTPSELSTISTLIRSLCDSDDHPTAIRLLSAALLTSPPTPLSSLPIPFLTDQLSSLPSLSPAFSLLTTLRHHHHPSHLPLFCSLLISSFLQRRRPDAAAQVLRWLCREDSPCRPSEEVYAIYVGGLCKGEGRALEVVKVVREMVKDGVEIGEEVRRSVWGILVKEARVEEAMELDRAFGSRDGIGEVVERMMKEWEE